jgi:putative tricarboxylic transport membrane protein
MGKADRQSIKKDKRLKPLYFDMLCVAIFSLLVFASSDGKAADPSADYPSRPIDYIVHTAPGSPHDVTGRLMSDIIQKEKILSQPLVVINKQGSGGVVASGYLYERKGNPYLVLAVSSSSFIFTPLLEKLPYNYKAFSPIANLMAEGSILVVRSDSPFKTADDIIAEARKRPKELNQGGGSFTSAGSIMGRSMQKTKGVQWNFISFAGADADVLLNVLSGNVQFAFVDPQAAVDYVNVGKVRVLLAGAPDRYPQFKNVPTMKEAGMGEAMVPYRGIVGPPNMPDYAVKKLEALFKKIMDNDRFKKYRVELGLMPAWMPSDEYGKFLDKRNDLSKELLSGLDLLKKK